MAIEKIDLLIEGGKAAPNAQIAQTLGPLKINIPEVIKKVNEKTTVFHGMKVPVKLKINTEDKSYEISVGSPPVSELIKKEINAQILSGQPNKDKIANLSIEQVIKVAKMKEDSMLANSLKAAVKNIIGSCNSMGILIEGKTSKEINKDIDSGLYDKEILEEKTQPSKEKLSKLKSQLEYIRAELKKEIEKEEPKPVSEEVKEPEKKTKEEPEKKTKEEKPEKKSKEEKKK